MENGIKKEEKECEICKSTATNICYDCLNYLCDSCFEFIHIKSANLLHQTESIDSFLSIDIKCPEHPQNSINLFCATEKSKIFFIYFLIYRIILFNMLYFKWP